MRTVKDWTGTVLLTYKKNRKPKRLEDFPKTETSGDGTEPRVRKCERDEKNEKVRRTDTRGEGAG